MRAASYAPRQTTRLDIKVSVDLAKVIAALTVLMLIFFHPSEYF